MVQCRPTHRAIVDICVKVVLSAVYMLAGTWLRITRYINTEYAIGTLEVRQQTYGRIYQGTIQECVSRDIAGATDDKLVFGRLTTILNF